MFKKSLYIFFVATLCCVMVNAQKTSSASAVNLLKLWDNKPAKDWMTAAYPIGNGRMGGMIFGGIDAEHIQFNENTLWTGNETDRGTYQAFGDLFIDFKNQGDSTDLVPADYQRALDLNTAIHRISYTRAGLKYKREYFCSFPDRVMVMHFTASQKAAYTATIRLKDAHGARVTTQGTELQFAGKLANGMAYQARALIKIVNGSSAAQPDGKGGFQLHISKADSFTVLLSATTDFLNVRAQHWKGAAPAQKIKAVLSVSSATSYPSLLARHVKDYQNLFGRVSLNLGNNITEIAKIPTRQRLLNYKKNADPQLEALIFQYGRYLLIGSSRKGGLPANLQGLWNNSNDPAWGSDYHTNINIQMNYWLAEPTNLAECHFSYLDHINSIREVRKINTQKEYPGVRGWTLRTESNPFGGESYKWNTPASAWYAQALWEHYSFSRDTEYLRKFAYPILKEVSEFWDDHLKRRPDGTLVSPMGWSPEHGPTEDGVTHDQQIVYDLFTNYIEAADVLGMDKAYRDHISDLKAHLLQPKIGKWGQLQEWETDRDDPKDQHRHVSHLFGLHPGRQISTITTPELAQAAKVSLLARGDASTGWSMAWKMNFWARLQDGDHAYKILTNFITPVGGNGIDYNEGGGIYANLLCAHPPFQIDGNLGYTAGVAEMLVQSQTSEIQLLPALPEKWANGSVSGLKARGNFEITEMEWKNGRLWKVTISSLSGADCTLRVNSPLKGNFGVLKNTLTGNSAYRYTFSTKKGGKYSFTAAL